MNYTPDVGWYYISLNDRAAAWTSVEYFARFMLGNRGAGPFGRLIDRSELEVGDVIQLGNSNGFYHSLIAVAKSGREISVAAHTRDVYGARLSDYSFTYIRCLRISKARKYR